MPYSNSVLQDLVEGGGGGVCVWIVTSKGEALVWGTKWRGGGGGCWLSPSPDGKKMEN